MKRAYEFIVEQVENGLMNEQIAGLLVFEYSVDPHRAIVMVEEAKVMMEELGKPK